MVALDGWALASRLSYFFLNSMPDGELFAAAEAGQLANAGRGRPAQATRLMGTPRFRDTRGELPPAVAGDHRAQGGGEGPELFPAWNEALRAAMLEEPRRFVDHVMTEGDGKLATLLSASYSVLSGPLYELYGRAPAGRGARPAGRRPTSDPEPARRAAHPGGHPGLAGQGGSHLVHPPRQADPGRAAVHAGARPAPGRGRLGDRCAGHRRCPRAGGRPPRQARVRVLPRAVRSAGLRLRELRRHRPLPDAGERQADRHPDRDHRHRDPQRSGPRRDRHGREAGRRRRGPALRGHPVAALRARAERTAPTTSPR